ncbi:MAG: tyrosine-type recombinase/integrase [Acidobacteria bacterium]|nr:tyrosine-type recombinase/integrase [Acidobacteriota bacterium]
MSDLRFHNLRHTAATYMVTGGIDLDTVKEILGHATIQMTMRFARPTPENKRRAVEVLAALFGQNKENLASVHPPKLQEASNNSPNLIS